MYTTAPRTTKPRVSLTRKRAWNGLRERIGLGEKLTSETTSRCGGLTLVTGIDVLPSASFTWPAGPVAGGGGLVAAFTVELGRETAELVPALFAARTSTRMRWPTSAATRTYVFAVAPEMSAQLLPPLPHRRHWYANVIGFVPPQSPLSVVRVEPSLASPEMLGTARTVGGSAAVVAPAMPTSVARVASSAPAAADSRILPLVFMFRHPLLGSGADTRTGANATGARGRFTGVLRDDARARAPLRGSRSSPRRAPRRRGRGGGRSPGREARPARRRGGAAPAARPPATARGPARARARPGTRGRRRPTARSPGGSGGARAASRRAAAPRAGAPRHSAAARSRSAGAGSGRRRRRRGGSATSQRGRSAVGASRRAARAGRARRGGGSLRPRAARAHREVVLRPARRPGQHARGGARPSPRRAAGRARPPGARRGGAGADRRRRSTPRRPAACEPRDRRGPRTDRRARRRRGVPRSR